MLMISRELQGLEPSQEPSGSRAARIASIAVLALIIAAAAATAQKTIDRVAAVVDRQVITLSEIDQMVAIRFFPRRTSASDDDYRHDVLEALIAQTLRLRDVQRFGAQDVPKDSIEARLQEMEKRFASEAEYMTALRSAELSLDDVRALVKRQLQVESYVQERLAPLILVSNEEIQSYYNTTWSQQRRERGLPIPPLPEVREEIRTLLKSTRLQSDIDQWTEQLRAHVNVDVYTWRG
jgi:parvulin-like peptidyl-prolyl isomerase